MKTSLRRRLIVVAALILPWAGADLSRADDAALYEKPLDPKAAFVRVIAPGAKMAAVDSKSFSGLDNGVTPYVAVTPGEIPVSSNLAEGKLTASAGKFYTAVLTERGVHTIEDKLTRNPAKANLTLYNLSDSDNLSLFVPQAGADALSGVGAGLAKSVALRAPMTIDLVVRNKEKDLATIKSVELSRNGGVAVVVARLNGTISAVIAPSTIAR
jgi:hypothetical protein